MPQNTELSAQVSWAHEVFRALGWTPEEIEAAQVAEPPTDPVQSAQAERRAYADTVAEDIQETLQSDTTQSDLNELTADLAGNDGLTGGGDPQLTPLVERLLARIRSGLQAEQALIAALEEGAEGKPTLVQSAARTGRLLDKADAEGKLGRFDTAQATLAEAEAALGDLRTLRLSLSAPPAAEPSDEIRALAGDADKGAAALRDAGFSGPAETLVQARGNLMAAQCPAADPAWKALQAEAKLAVSSAGKFRALAVRIGTYCTSLANEGLGETADGLRDSLEEIRSSTARTVMGSFGFWFSSMPRQSRKTSSQSARNGRKRS